MIPIFMIYFPFSPHPIPMFPNTVVEQWSVTGELSLSYARPIADG